MSEKSNFEKMAAIDVSKHIEKKGNLSYLSWAWAVQVLLTHDPMANWAYNAPFTLPDGSMLVTCTVTAFGKPMTMHLPVMDYKNKAILKPNSFDLNTAMMRCLVKCIALHGLGLYIYAGEDLPEKDAPEPTKSAPASVWDTMPESKQRELQGIVDSVRACMEADKMEDACNTWSKITDADEKTAGWSRFASGERTKLKAHAAKMKQLEDSQNV